MYRFFKDFLRIMDHLGGARDTESPGGNAHISMIFKKYHPRKRELFEMIDEKYLKKLNRMIETPD